MAENTAISWANHTFNPWIGCTRVSPACDGCYAAALMGGEGGRFKRAEWGGPGKGEGTRDRTKDWRKPRKWNREASAAPGQTFLFCASLADVFDNAVPAEWRRDLFQLIRETPNLTWLLLTKRPGNIVRQFCDITDQLYDRHGIGKPSGWPSNAAIGCTVVNQAEADRDVPKLLQAKAMLRPAFAFLSMEPLLEAVDLTPFLYEPCANAEDMMMDPSTGSYECCARCDFTGISDEPREDGIGWIITGGETDQGPHKARDTPAGAFQAIRDQCAAAGVAYQHKQNKGGDTRDLDGRFHDDRPEVSR